MKEKGRRVMRKGEGRGKAREKKDGRRGKVDDFVRRAMRKKEEGKQDGGGEVNKREGKGGINKEDCGLGKMREAGRGKR